MQIGTTDLVVTYAGSEEVDQFDIAVTRDLAPVRRRVREAVERTVPVRH